MPQTIIIDVSQLNIYPKNGFNTFGIYCWHAYNTNPKSIELLISDNYSTNNKNSNFNSLGIFELEMRDGIQLFPIDYNVLDDTSIKNKIKAFKIIIKSTYGGNKTYINQIMFYENTAKEIKEENNNNESFQNDNNGFQHEINLPEDLSNSQISNEDKEKEKQEIQMQNKKRNSNISNNNNKQYIVDYISETHSNYNTEMNENNNYNIEKNESIRDDIKVEENNDIHDNFNNDNEEENENNDEENKIIATSDELEYPYENKCDRNITTNNNPLNENKNQKKNLKIPNKNSAKSKKVQKLEKILKENILNNDYNRKDINELYINNSIPNQTEYNKNKMDYMNHQTINNYPSLMQFKNDYIIKNNQNLNNISTRNIQDNNIQKYFKLNVQTPKRLTVKGYDNLLNKRRPYTPKLNEINRNSISAQYNINEFKNQTSMAGFNKINDNNNREYETLEIQLQDMEQHLKNMALDNDISSKINYNSRTNREYNIKNMNKNNYFNNEIMMNNNYIDKKTKNISMISNRSSFLLDQQKNINTNNSNINYNSPNKNYFNHYKTEYKNNSSNNINNDEEYGINKRIDDLEKNMLEIKEELNNISSNLNIFMNKDNFLYNFKDSIKQICYDFFTERVNNNSNNNNHENINNEFYNKEQMQNGNNNEENENNSQYSDDYSDNKNVQNEKIKIENEINQKIDEKLEYLCDNLQNQIFEKYLKPSINEIEKSMRENIEDIKEKVESINQTNITNNSYLKNKYSNIMDNEENINYNNDYDTYSIINKNKEQNLKDLYHKTSSRIKKEKYEEINRLGEKLYDKLLEKEKKLKLLNQETNLLISKKQLGNNSFED